jgi:hypothetical protein
MYYKYVLNPPFHLYCILYRGAYNTITVGVSTFLALALFASATLLSQVTII